MFLHKFPFFAAHILLSVFTETIILFMHVCMYAFIYLFPPKKKRMCNFNLKKKR